MIRCNLTNDIWTTYKGKFGNKCLSFVRMISQALFVNTTEDPNRNKVDPDILANAPDITKDRVYDFLGRYGQRVHSNEFIH
jgi:hypothetical protein